MSSTVITPQPEVKPTPTELYAQTVENRGKTAEQLATEAAEKTAEAERQKRPSGDERKFQRRLQRATEALRSEFEEKFAALKPKEKAAESESTEEAPKREAFASDEEYQDARVKFLAKQEAEKLIKNRESESSQNQTVKEAVEGYNKRMERGPQKYDDWDDTLKSAKGAALNVDLSKECPALFWAITISPYNDDIFYAWLKDSSKLQGLIDQYKKSPEEAIAAFHRFEGRVGKDEVPEKKEKPMQKADDAARKPKPSSEVSVKGTAAATGKPDIYLPGTHTINPEWQVWRRNQN